MSVGENGESWEKAKSLLLGAVDAVIHMKDQSQPKRLRLSHSDGTATLSSQSSCSTSAKKQSVYDEHRNLFGYQPSKVYSGKVNKGKNKGSQSKKKAGTWTKEVICLRECQQDVAPTIQEKMELAKCNLGLKKLVFSAEGDVGHIHNILLEAFPILETCGGYSLLRVLENSKHLVEIEGPDSGVNVPFLKDILRQAKLYIRPLQEDIPEQNLHQDNELYLGDEPMEICRECNKAFPMSKLRKHVQFCAQELSKCKQNEDDTYLDDDLQVYDLFSEEHNTLGPPLTIQESSHFKEASIAASSTYKSYINLLDESDNEWENDPVVQQMLIPYTSQNTEELDVQQILENHRLDTLYEDHMCAYRVTIRRSNIWEDAKRAMQFNFDERQHVMVTFLGESAVDGGGPRREFFMLFMNVIKENHYLLDGPSTKRILRHNTTALQEELYLFMGKMISLSLIHGGPGPSFFSQSIVNYLFHGLVAVKPTIDEIPDPAIQELMQKETNSDEEFRHLVCSIDYAFLLDYGVTKPAAKMNIADKEKVISAVCLHCVVLSSLAELEQFKRGLQTARMSMLLERYPSLQQLFLHSDDKPITADFIQDLFKVDYSPSGSNNRNKEEALMINWIHYLKDLETSGESPTLKDVFIFLTGCSEVPPLGFPEAEAKVNFSNTSLPTVSTCALTLTIPYSFPTEYIQFKDKMNFSILNSQGFFGQV